MRYSLTGPRLAALELMARRAATVVAQQPRSTSVFASDRLADWLLWRVPSLRGRIAYDVRFELLKQTQLDPLLAFADQRGADWDRVTSGYNVIVLDLRHHSARLARLRSKPAAPLLYEKADEFAIIRRGKTGADAP